MFVSRAKIVHGKDLRSCTIMTDTRIRGTSNLVASNIHTITAHTSDVTAVAYSNNLLATCSADKTVRLWDTKDYSEMPSSPLTGHSYLIHCCAFSPLGTTLATCSTDGTLRMWDVKSGQCLASLAHPSKCAIRVCSFSKDGKMIVTGGDDDSACLWEVASKKLIRSFKGHDESVVSAAFTPDNNYLVTGSSGIDFGGDLLVWDAKYGHGKFLTRVSACHDLAVSCCEFSPTYGSASGSANSSSITKFLLATGGKDNLVKLWVFEGEVGSVNVKVTLETMLPGHKETVQWLCFSPNGQYIASCSLDRTVRLWSADSWQCLIDIDEHTSYVTFCAFSVDNQYLATSSNDNTVKIWKLNDTSAIMNKLSGYESGEDTGSALQGNFTQVAMEMWSVEDVCQWLSALGLPEHEDRFRDNAIDGKELLALTTADLETLGVVALGHRNKIVRTRDMCKESPSPNQRAEPSNMPNEFLCPITQELMKDPVIAADGYTYDRPAILSWMQREQRSPLTNMELASTQLTPNRTLKMMIHKFLQAS
ncbi:WD repeat, sam and u-box domain-containing protein 1 [Plakobranchus ocellatus]|uniref:WD repeat, SAM and U-box domain-containing protein 1 n=1 Tax=Plakobranchus ocellatus TaxID=259542 RepID=A0AAV4CIJ3_9GAST|nr:WD repeat, sam and u-box domain-containing protein 1 [Plakobranchus ocellatus]